MPLPFEISKLRKDSRMNSDEYLRKYYSMDMRENTFIFSCLFCLALLVALLLLTTGCVTIGRSATTTSSQTTTPNISLSFVHIGDMQTTSGAEDTRSIQESNAKLQDTLKDLLKGSVPIEHLDVGGIGGGVAKKVSSVKEKVKSRPKLPSLRRDSDSSNSGDGDAPEASALWKPVSETTNELVVLLDSSYTGHVSGVALEENGEIIQGHFSSIANGNREHYRGFGKAGSGFSPPVTMIVSLKDGSVHSGVIDSPAGRDQVDLHVRQ